jgi:DNA-directed RNA polymerase II subunit RPB1
MALERFPHSSAPIKRISSVQMSVWDPDELVRSAQDRLLAQTCSGRGKHFVRVLGPMRTRPPQRKYSVAKIETSDTYEKGLPKAGGLSDLRMGTTEKRGAVCTTDGADMRDCPGYFGHIELAKPMYHCGFIKTVVKVLRCVSYHTSRLLVDKVRRVL